MAVVALVLHFKNGLVKTKGVGYIIVPAIVFSVVGALVTNSVKPRVLKICFGIFFLAMGVFELISSIKNIKNQSKSDEKQNKKDKKQQKNKG